MARSRLSGILLVGGGSTRFGSPKALAVLDGETLSDRAWRTLTAAFDEVVAVGKTADGFEFPFALVDDGAEERAPIFGVMAGLRAVASEVAVVLPVDCPLVTVELLQALGEAVAVPQTGPLPGAYSKAMLPEIEARVARGEFSLRGVNPTVLEVDEALLADVDVPVDLARLS